MNYKENKKCPYCEKEDTIENFIKWEENGERGLLGKSSDGFIMILCPQCKKHIKFDSLSNKFLKEEQKAKSGIIFNIIFLLVIVIIIYFIVKIFV